MTRFNSTALLVCVSTLLLFGFISRADDEPGGDLPAATEKKVDFARDIQPIFVKSCNKCHGAKKQEGGFRLDQKTQALNGGDTGPSILPGKSAESLLIRYVAGLDPDVVMPPEGDLLTKTQVSLLRGWIDQGAVWPKGASTTGAGTTHWSYLPVERFPVPDTKDSSPVRNSIDNFVVARLEDKAIQPSPAADRYTLIRRLSLDLLGLPPTIQEIDEFVNDKSPNAYEALVDRMLKSQHFGERWARHWLDKARYADSDGYEKDRPRPNAWRWRDWVINAVNQDMPFDQFTIEQQAGDLLPNATETQKLATAFNRQTLTNTEGGTDQEQWRVEAVFDRVETTGAVWLGLTIGCARCHSHKYDQISQREYYQMFAFLNNGDETNLTVPTSAVAVAQYNTGKTKHDKAVAELQSKLAAHKTKLNEALPKWEAQVQAKLKTLGKNEIKFQPLDVIKIESMGGATLKKLDDGSYLASGQNPDVDRYTLVVKSSVDDITGFRVETLADKSLPAGGPGRVKHGNFVLSGFQVAVSTTADAKQSKPVELTNATADYNQKEWPAAAAIDGDLKTGWAIAQQFNKDHNIVFATKSPLSIIDGGYFKIVLEQQYGTQHTIGRLRITARTGTKPGDAVPDNIRKILANAANKRDAKQKQTLLDYFASTDAAVAKLTKDLKALQAKAPKAPTMNVRVISQRTNGPRQTHVLRRGDFLQPQKDVVIEPAGLATLHPLKPRSKDGKTDRLDLAYWLASPQNPLTPRVAVNHVWSHLFGRGLVSTISDFGVRGEKPSHPKLLDWLASEFIRLKWSRKALIRLIVNSATYRQSSAFRPELRETDPQNRLLYRQNRFRVEAETVRDMSLAASGLLSRKVAGPSVFPPLPPDIADLSYANNFKWATSKNEDRYRRGMYTFFKRTAPHPNLTTFDCPDSNTTCVERHSSNTPLQALTTLNNEVFVEASQALARRVLSEPMKTDADRLKFAHMLCVARPPSASETEQFTQLLSASRAWYKAHADQAKAIVGSYETKNVPIDETAAWVATSRILLNLDGFITRE